MRIYYSDGGYYEGDPMEAPISGVQVIVEKVGNRMLQHSLGNYYGWDGEIWESGNKVQDHWETILYGEKIETERFKQIRGEAIEWLSRQ